MSEMSVSPSMRPGGITVNVERWPLIHVRFQGSAEISIWDSYLAQLTRAITTRPGKRVMIMDASECGMVSAAARRKQAEWMARHDENTRLFTVGIAFVLPSSLLRGALTAVFWLQPLPCPYAIVKDNPTGLERCDAWLASHGMTALAR